jgi:hypothetical protein
MTMSDGTADRRYPYHPPSLESMQRRRAEHYRRMDLIDAIRGLLKATSRNVSQLGLYFLQYKADCRENAEEGDWDDYLCQPQTTKTRPSYLREAEKDFPDLSISTIENYMAAGKFATVANLDVVILGNLAPTLQYKLGREIGKADTIYTAPAIGEIVKEAAEKPIGLQRARVIALYVAELAQPSLLHRQRLARAAAEEAKKISPAAEDPGATHEPSPSPTLPDPDPRLAKLEQAFSLLNELTDNLFGDPPLKYRATKVWRCKEFRAARRQLKLGIISRLAETRLTSFQLYGMAELFRQLAIAKDWRGFPERQARAYYFGRNAPDRMKFEDLSA